ncbi:MAG: hypothetical protein PHC61_06895 [Chitinivibrionales bacterium]|nr:hypothetical protein [Chitinivibrionales bacterium]
MIALIADASPLILLAKLAMLEKVCQSFRIVSSSNVIGEATRKKDLPDALHISNLAIAGAIQIKTVDGTHARRMQNTWNLGSGEASIFVLAASGNDMLLIDDYAAIAVARAQNRAYLTTPVLIYEMARRRLITNSLAREKLITLKQFAWISDEIIDTVLSWLGKKE